MNNAHMVQRDATPRRDAALSCAAGKFAYFSTLSMKKALATAAARLHASPMTGGDPSYTSNTVPVKAVAAAAQTEGGIGRRYRIAARSGTNLTLR